MIKPKGTLDIFSNIDTYNYIISTFKQICELQGYKQIITPHFEYKDLFINNDQKEIFIFDDKYALKPENTASIVRAYLENKLYANNFNKFYYISSMFRKDSPQRGRYREFTQLGIELFNQANPLSDIEVLISAYEFLKRLNIVNTLFINTIGCLECRINYINILKEYLQKQDLCEDCKKRLINNPLRILDCKKCKFDNIPHIIDYVCNDCKKHFQFILSYLNYINIPYIIDHNLVRGLDYYTQTVFEFKSNQLEAAQSTIIGGGRYNNLIQIKNNYIPAIGYAAGLERLMLLFNKDEKIKNYVYIISKNYKQDVLRLYRLLLCHNIPTKITYTNNSLTKQLKSIKNCKYVIIIEDDEINNNYYTIKNLNNSTQVQIDKNYIIGYLLNSKGEIK